MPVFYTQKEAAEYLRVSEKTIQRQRKRGALPFLKIGSDIRIRQEHLDALLKEAAPTASFMGKSWQVTRWTSDAEELPNSITRTPTRPSKFSIQDTSGE